MYEFIVREFMLQRMGIYNVVQVRLQQVRPRTTPKPGEMTLYFREDDSEVAQFYHAARTHEPIKVAFPQDVPVVPTSDETW